MTPVQRTPKRAQPSLVALHRTDGFGESAALGATVFRRKSTDNGRYYAASAHQLQQEQLFRWQAVSGSSLAFLRFAFGSLTLMCRIRT